MRPRSVFDFDVSVTADKRRRQRHRVRGQTGAFETAVEECQWPGCRAQAAYRAPHSPDRLDEFRWFCLEHVREYNASWNYFASLSEAEMDAQFDADRVWERPTWGFGKGPKSAQGMHPHAEGKAWARFGFRDLHEVLGENATINPAAAEQERPRRRLAREEQEAMDTLGLPHQVETRGEVRARYRELVKELHPDMNGGSNPEPERLARVLKAWQILRKSRNFTD